MKKPCLAGLLLLITLFGYGRPAASQVDVEAILADLNATSRAKRNEVLVAGARKEGKLQWNTTMPVTEAQDFIDRFNKKYPFVEVQYSRLSGTAVVNRVITESKAGAQSIDVFGARGTLHYGLMNAGIVAKNEAPFRRELRDGFIDRDGYFSGNFTYALVIGYNARAVPGAKAPTSYQSLLAPEWNGQMSLDFESYEWLAGILDIMGEEKGLDFARKLAAHNLRIIRGHSLLTQQLAAGEIQILIDAYHHQMIRFKEKGAPVDFVVPETMIIKEPSGIWISRKARYPHAAALFVDFLFSKDGQEVYQNGHRLVARKDMEWNFGGKKLGRTHVLSMEKWGRNYDRLTKTFHQIFK